MLPLSGLLYFRLALLLVVTHTSFAGIAFYDSSPSLKFGQVLTGEFSEPSGVGSGLPVRGTAFVMLWRAWRARIFHGAREGLINHGVSILPERVFY